jgi:hypothetical protein
LIHCDDIKTFDDNFYCDNCWFNVKDEAISEVDIKNVKILRLVEYLKANKLTICYEILKEVDFRITGYDFTIEACNGGGWYRLGSFCANFWVYLTSKQSDLLKAIDYILQEDSKELEYIKISDTIIE